MTYNASHHDRSTATKAIKDHPIGDGLDAFHASFKSVCRDRRISCSPDTLAHFDHEGLQKLSIDLILALQGLRVSRLLRSASGGKNLFSDLSRLGSSVNSDDVDLDRIKPLLNAVLAVDPDDMLIWDQVYRAINEPTPPPDRHLLSNKGDNFTTQIGFANSLEVTGCRRGP
ncbi:hypothetical protein V2G26_001810 [Clonostachys chloroleuca]